ncbi:MAG: hypothetical protein NT135_03395 [Candidatus Berkelbacteria bacterium]|nr:hypothetical protein [Candidatus Berkelbacteria bacterium]
MSNYVVKAVSFLNKNKIADRTLLCSCEHPLYFLIETKHSWLPTNALAYRIIQTVKNKFSERNSSLSENFEEALKETNEILAKLTEEGQTEWVDNLSAIILLIDQDALSLTSLGSSSCFLIREGNAIEITADQPKETHPLRTFSHILNGQLKEKDRLILGNPEFFEKVPLDYLKKVIAGSEVANLIQKERIKKANALILQIESGSPTSVSSSETIYLDEDKAKIILMQSGKYLSSFFKWILKQTKRIFSFLYKKTKHNLPKAQKYINQSHQKITAKTKTTSQKTGLSKIFSALAGYKRWILVGFSGVLIFALIFEITVVLKNRFQSSELLSQRKTIMAAEDKTRTADELVKQGKQEEAIKNYKEALQLVSQMNNKDANILSDKINAKLDKLNNIVRIDPKEYLDFNVFKNATVSQIILAEKTIYSVDSKTNQIYKEKSNPSSLPQYSGQFIYGSFQDQEKLLVFYQENDGVYEYKIDENKVEKAKTVFDQGWEKAKIIATYFTNLYLLNPEQGQIYKYEKTAAGYSKGSAYVNKDNVDLKKAISFALDGYVYVLNNDGTVIKLMAGRRVNNFTINGIPENETGSKIKNPIKIITFPEQQSLYILDGNQILEFDKTGKYQKMLVINNITNIKDFAVSPKNKKIYLLSGTKVYEFGL